MYFKVRFWILKYAVWLVYQSRQVGNKIKTDQSHGESPRENQAKLLGLRQITGTEIPQPHFKFGVLHHYEENQFWGIKNDFKKQAMLHILKGIQESCRYKLSQVCDTKRPTIHMCEPKYNTIHDTIQHGFWQGIKQHWLKIQKATLNNWGMSSEWLRLQEEQPPGQEGW